MQRGQNRSRRLPGVRFEVAPPPLDLRLPRMDIAVFVGFAASGPLHVPVAIEDPRHFEDVFGADAPLAFDPVAAEPVRAFLAPAVRAFFQNGGRRCFVIRVAYSPVSPALREAGAARLPESDRFPIPGLLQRVGKVFVPAFAAARSEGSWADGYRSSANLTPAPIGFRNAPLDTDPSALRFTLKLASTDEIAPGDLLRATFTGAPALVFIVDRIEPLAVVTEEGAHRSLARVTGRDGLWIESDPSALSVFGAPLGQITARAWSNAGSVQSFPVLAVPEVRAAASGSTLAVSLDLGAPPWPEPGSFLHIEWPGGDAWMVIDSIASPAGGPFPPLSGNGLVVAGPTVALLDAPATPIDPAHLARIERCTFEVRVRRGDAETARMSDLAFDAAHPRFFCALPTDRDLYAPNPPLEDADPRLPLRAEAATPARFPLAGDDPAASYVPAAMPLFADVWLAAAHGPRSALARDGLAPAAGPPAPPDPLIFLDDELAGESLTTLQGAIDFISYQSPAPRRPQGLHAAWSIEEATLIAVPDAIHGVFQEIGVEPPHPPAPSPPIAQPPWGQFLDCALRPVDPPSIAISDGPDAGGTYLLTWTAGSPDAGPAQFELQEATRWDWSDAVTIYQGPDDHRTFHGRQAGVYYYRVRYTAGINASDWSPGIIVSVAQASRWEVAPALFAPSTLIAVQRALLRLCAARGDLFAVLGLPAHYREDQSIAHPTAWRALGAVPGEIVPPFDGGEAGAPGFGAIYHPWLIAPDTAADDLRAVPPDGAMTGVIARRTIARGAWVAPANEAATSVVALTPPILRERWLDLQEAHINVIRQEPRGFLALCEDTLSPDEDLVPINVRRLLSLLRRAALDLGARYVFESNDRALQRLVRRSFEALLDYLWRRGAFTGVEQRSAFQVIVDDTVNPPARADSGRFVVELKVAPALPLRFITVRLLKSGDRSVVTEAV